MAVGSRARAVATCLPPRRRRKDRPGIETSLPVRAAAARAPRGAGGLRAAEGYRVHEHLVSRAAPPAGPPALPPARPPAPRHPAAAAASAAGGAVSLPGARFVPGAAELGGRHGVQHGPGDDPCGFSGEVSGSARFPPPTWRLGVVAPWPLPSVCLSTAVVVVWAFLPYVAQDVCVYCEPWGTCISYAVCVCVVC